MNEKKVEIKSCCTPTLEGGRLKAESSVECRRTSESPKVAELKIEMVNLSGGSFLMGDSFDEGYDADGEFPVHSVVVSPFSIALTSVTNSQFAQFIAETGYKTDAERFGSSVVFHLAVSAELSDIAGALPETPWWIEVRGADWAHPNGRISHWQDVPEHPAVHISWYDAQAFCKWAGTRLPTEAEWEYIARGGHDGKRYPWGNDFLPNGVKHCNTFVGDFPQAADPGSYNTTTPVKSYTPNDFGVWQTQGNVWEWCADWFSALYYQVSPTLDPQGPKYGIRRVMRGGSYLCHFSYCNRYRVAARSSNVPNSSSANCGFRVALKGRGRGEDPA